jgi:hypothetical protein
VLLSRPIHLSHPPPIHPKKKTNEQVLENLRAEAAQKRAAVEALQGSGVDRELEGQIRVLQTELGRLQVSGWVY